MYFLLFLVHWVFVYVGYEMQSLWTMIFFVLLFLFFSLYFSPFFLSKQKWLNILSDTDAHLIQLSPTHSILPAVSLFYIAIYGITYSIFGTIDQIMVYHVIIGSCMYLAFLAYYLITQKASDIFTLLVRYHSLFVIGVSIVYFLVIVFTQAHVQIYVLILLLIALLTSFSLLYYWGGYVGEDVVFVVVCLLGWVTALAMFLYLLGITSIFALTATVLVFSLWLFFIPTPLPLEMYDTLKKYFSVIWVYISMVWGYYLIFSDLVWAFLILAPIIAMFVYIHNLYENYISYCFAIVNIFILYSYIFISLFLGDSFFQSFLFIYFLPIVLIGSSYFWVQKYQYDFIILHYLSILSSIVFSIYYLFFISSTSDVVFFGSFFLFGISTLSFMSYFRFRTIKTNHDTASH